MATRNERHTNPACPGSSRVRWIAFVLVAAAIAIGVVLLVIHGGGSSGGPY